VIAAISEEIKSHGGSESNTEYFAALVSLLLLLFCPVFLLLNVCLVLCIAGRSFVRKYFPYNY